MLGESYELWVFGLSSDFKEMEVERELIYGLSSEL